VGEELRSRLGRDALVARSVNGRPGLWVRFYTGRDAYWLRAAQANHGAALPTPRGGWALLLLGTVVGSVAIASLINRPLKQLSFAASRIREGNLRFAAGRKHADQRSA
jgi:two-component system osmolarity sensor histidine kinase EnvZ